MQRGFSEYFTNSITKKIRDSPDIDVTEIKVDTRMRIVRPLHAKIIKDAYDMFKSDRGKIIIGNGWKMAGITQAVREARNPLIEDILDPFAGLQL